MSPVRVIRRPPIIEYGQEAIPYETVFVERGTLEIGVHPDGSVHVRAPLGRSPEAVHERVQSRARWIVRQRSFFDAIGPPPVEKAYVSGETHRYLGRQYRLRVRLAPEAPERVRLTGPYLEISAHDDARGTLRELVRGWYRTRAEARLPERYERGHEQVRRYGVASPPPMRLRWMRTRWGSYTASGVVLLNPALMTTPLYCIDYVILHELCHAVYPHHGTDFYHLLERVLPDWKAARQRLDRLGT